MIERKVGRPQPIILVKKHVTRGALSSEEGFELAVEATIAVAAIFFHKFAPSSNLTLATGVDKA
jgi:hypothetical protein